MRDLAQLRAELAETDRKIIKLIADRQKLAHQVGIFKEAYSLATRDFSQEKEVVERAQEVARKVGIPSQLVTDLFRLLIRHALTTQEQHRVMQQGKGSGQRVLVIGGAGRMGQWMVRFLSSQGFHVEIADPAQSLEGFTCFGDWKESDLQHQIIVIATPLRVTAEILPQLAVRKPPGLVFDIGSLKSSLRTGLRTLLEAGVRATSIHPMFGPETELLSNRHVIIVDVGNEEANREVAELFDSTMASQVMMSIDDHDRLIAYVLGLSHALSIVFVTALAESGEAAPRLAQLSSTTFDAQLSVAASVAAENPHLYFEIQSLNDYATESLSALLYAVERVRSVVRAGDEGGFVRLMEKGLEYLSQRPNTD